MKAMVITRITEVTPDAAFLENREMPRPSPGPGEILVRVSVCGVCHTELDEIEGRTPPPRWPVIPGHQVVGRVEECGRGSGRFKPGERVGVAWIYSACGRCPECLEGRENLCPDFRATGRDADGGYAEFMVVRENFAYHIPKAFSDAEAAPLLCAGAVGYRSLKLANLRPGQSLGLTGFGASGHLVLQMAKFFFPQTDIFVFARNSEERDFAVDLGASWAGDTMDRPPEKMDSIIDTTPAWRPVVEALRNLKPGGRLVINAVRKEPSDKDELGRIDYTDCLWMEKEIKSVANVTRADVTEFLRLIEKTPIRPTVDVYPLEEAGKALLEIKRKWIRGAKVLKI